MPTRRYRHQSGYLLIYLAHSLLQVIPRTIGQGDSNTRRHDAVPLLLVDVPTPNVDNRKIVIHRNVPLATDVYLIRRRLAPRRLPNIYVDLFDHVDETRPSRTGKVGTVLRHLVMMCTSWLSLIDIARSSPKSAIIDIFEHAILIDR